MSAFIQRQFKVRGSDDTLSDRDSGALATKAVMLLSSGAFLLQWVGLVLYVGFSSSPTGGVSWPHIRISPLRISMRHGALSTI